MASDGPVNRRQFFRTGLRQLLKPLADAVEPVQQVVRQLNALQAAEGAMLPTATAARAKPQTPLDAFLRPPGALEEKEFLNTCQRCQACLRACPVCCIQIDELGLRAGGAPFIDPNRSACVVCEGLQCMSACPSGALRPIPLNQIDMGTAVWKPDTCSRSKGLGCTICIDQCPLGEAAIELRDGLVYVQGDGCIGCGVCQHDCPTNPKSITIVPRPRR